MLVMLLLVAPVSGLSVSGAKYMGSIKPGGTDTHIISITLDPSESPGDMIAEVQGFGQDLDQSYKTLTPTDDRSPYSARSFITLDNSSVHVEPGTTKTITATIKLPQNTGAGGRYALIHIHAVPGAGQSFTLGVIIPVMITVAGTTPTETGTISNINVRDITLGQPIKIVSTFQNTGNYHYYHAVNWVALKDASGNIVSNASSPLAGYAIIPGNTVQYIVTPDVKNLPAGTYTADSKILLEDGRVLDEKTATFEVKTNYVPPLTETNMTVSPGSPATLTSPDGRYSVSFPQGAVLGDVVVTLKPYSKDKLSQAPAGAKLGSTCFEITGLAGLLSKDATVRVKYSTDDLAAAGGDASQLKLSYWDAAQGKWAILPTQVDAGSTTLTATTNHLSVWAVMVTSSTGGGGAATPTKATPLPEIVSLSALIIAVIISCDISRKRK